jgi:hypothetical protein
VLYEDDLLAVDELDDVRARQRLLDRVRAELLRDVDLDQLQLLFPERDVYRRPIVNVCRTL